MGGTSSHADAGEASRADRSARSSRGEATRTRILDGAEEMFARNGFERASVRDIATLCEVEPGLITYYFGSKARLLREVIERRATFGEQAMLDALDRVESGARAKAVDAILGAFAETILVPLQREHRASLNYMRLLVHLQRESATLEGVAGLESVMRPHYPVRLRYIRALEAALPGLDPAMVRFGFDLFEGSFARLLFDGEVDVDDAGQRRVRIEQMRQLLVPFTLGGFAALAGGPTGST